MTCGIVLKTIQMIEKKYNVDMLIYNKILTIVDNIKSIKANFKYLVTFRININCIQIFEINMFYEIKIIFEMLQ